MTTDKYISSGMNLDSAGPSALICLLSRHFNGNRYRRIQPTTRDYWHRVVTTA